MIRLAAPPAAGELPGVAATVLDDCLAAHGRDPAATAVDLQVLDDAAIARLNAAHTGRAGPTDVLAFPDDEPDPDDGFVHLGDVAVSAETARREAAARGVPPGEELLLYAVHGVLHLLGFRDGTEAERTAMRRAERQALARHGIEPHWEA
jgi:probable rRNA maturation factor